MKTKNTNKKTATKTNNKKLDNEIDRFISNYALLKDSIDILKIRYQAIHKYAKDIGNIAEKLYKFGNKKFYVDDATGTRAIDTRIPKIMDNLDFWRFIESEY